MHRVSTALRPWYFPSELSQDTDNGDSTPLPSKPETQPSPASQPATASIVDTGSQRSAGTRFGFMPQLDGLRAIAVILVLIDHWLPRELYGRLPLGAYGVNLFFVLSGFLITGILLESRGKAESAGSSRGSSLRVFYIRRALRIVPAFYLVLILMTAADIPPLRESFAWHAAYLTNFFYFLQGRFYGAATHFWSLSVEEQFYLLWPCVVLFVPRRALPWVMGAAIATGPLFRLGWIAWGPKVHSTQTLLTPSSLDALGLGSLLAWIVRKGEGFDAARRLTRGALLVGLPLLAVVQAAERAGFLPRQAAQLEYTAAALIWVWLVARAAEGFRGWFGALLQRKTIMFVGKISYGIYLIHVFPPFLVNRFELRRFFPSSLRDTWSTVVQVALWAAITFGYAMLSWTLFERPINALKRFFPYAWEKRDEE
jgi:peptidoglycan/LPS O-acetylase OafA/YrhL